MSISINKQILKSEYNLNDYIYIYKIPNRNKYLTEIFLFIYIYYGYILYLYIKITNQWKNLMKKYKKTAKVIVNLL